MSSIKIIIVIVNLVGDVRAGLDPPTHPNRQLKSLWLPLLQVWWPRQIAGIENKPLRV